MNFAEEFYSKESQDAKDEYFMQILKGGNYATFAKQAKEYLARDTNRVYYYLLTFTLDPRLAERAGGISESYYDRVERYIKKLANNKAWHLLFFAYVREGGDDDHKHTHWHVSIKTTKCFDHKRNLSYYMKLYGNVDKQVSKIKTNIYAKKYMSKQREPVILIGEWDCRKLDQNPNSQEVSKKQLCICWKAVAKRGEG